MVIFREYEYCTKFMKKYFNKNLVEKEFKRIDKYHNGNGDKSVRGHNHTTW